MTKMLASVLALGVMATTVGCGGGGGSQGASCAFDRGEASSSLPSDAKAFVVATLSLKKATDKLEHDWNAEMTALAKDLGVDPSEDTVLLKLKSNVAELKLKGSCELRFETKAEASAGAGSADADGSVHTDVKLKYDAKCGNESSVKSILAVTVPAVQKHFPVLLGISAQYAALGPRVKDAIHAGSKLISDVKDSQVLQEVTCAVTAVTNIKLRARIDFTGHATASASGTVDAT